jgi:hypothetical protein
MRLLIADGWIMLAPFPSLKKVGRILSFTSGRLVSILMYASVTS